MHYLLFPDDLYEFLYVDKYDSLNYMYFIPSPWHSERYTKNNKVFWISYWCSHISDIFFFKPVEWRGSYRDDNATVVEVRRVLGC